MSEIVRGDGWAVAPELESVGEGYGFRKLRKELGVTEFGVKVITIPPGYESGRHMHERQQELYLVRMGTLELEFGDGAKQVLKEGGYVGRDGLAPEDEGNPRGPGL